MTNEASKYLGLDWLAMCLTFGAIYLLGNKRRTGFLIMSAGNLCWSAIGLWAGSYAMVIANLGFLAMNLRGFAKWKPTPTPVFETIDQPPDPSLERP